MFGIVVILTLIVLRIILPIGLMLLLGEWGCSGKSVSGFDRPGGG